MTKPVPRLYTCKRCKGTWASRLPTRPRACGICKSAYWDLPRKKKTKSKKSEKSK